MTLWLLALMPDALPRCEQARRSSALRCRSFRQPGGPWMASARASRRLDDAAGGIELRSHRLREAGRGRPGRSRRSRRRSRSRAARHGAGGVDPVRRDPFAQAEERRSLLPVAEDVQRDEHFGMRRSSPPAGQVELHDGFRLVDGQDLRRDLPRAPLRVRLRRGTSRRVVEVGAARRRSPAARTDSASVWRQNFERWCRLARLAHRSDQLQRPERLLVGGQLRRRPCPCD